jgi:hypothetical protein
LLKVTSRVSKGTFEIKGVAIHGAAEFYEKAPNRHLMVFNVQGQKSFGKGFDGTIAWMDDPDEGVQEDRAESARAKRDAEFYRYIKLRELYPKLLLKGKTKVNEREAYVVEAPRNGSPKRWFFDIETGLLSRIEERDAQNELTQMQEFNDYREVDAIKLPFDITLVDGATFKIKLMEVKHNLVIDDAKFNKPVNK